MWDRDIGLEGRQEGRKRKAGNAIHVDTIDVRFQY